ncbi:MAG: SAM-dependent DNA methyltransferase [Verrucomicrobiia bacterium]
MPIVENHFQTAAKQLTEKTLAAAKAASNEASFRIPFQAAIAEAAQAIGAPIQPRDEVSLIEGRADTVYNRLVIEYEHPGFLKSSNKLGNNIHAIGQVKDYISGLHRRERHKMERYAGIVCDGCFFIFLRFRDEQWHFEPPVPVDVYSCERFLHYLAALQTELATTPENLLRDFGENTPASRKCVSAFYQVLTTSQNPKINALYRQWALTFSEICGYEHDSPKLDVEALARLYAVRAGARDKLQPFKLFFAIHSYYATFIKLLAVQIVNFYARTKVARIAHREPVTLEQAVGLDATGLQNYLRTMEEGGIFRHLGIRNFLEGDFFGWYLEEWTPDIEQALRGVMRQLANYSFVTLDTDPDGTRDLLKRLYQNLMPQELRHDLGEYYTPDWLATQLLNQLHSGTPDRSPRSPDERLLDMACGSGTFVVLHIRDIRLYARDELLPQRKITRQQLLQKILANVVGYDLNPLAVISARTNYLLALGDLLDQIEGEIDIPIYLADSILTPSAGETLDKQGKIFFTTSVGEFALPRSLVQATYIDPLANLLEEHVKNDSPAEAFRAALCEKFPLDPKKDARDVAITEELYCHLRELERQKINGIWARIIKNAFAPLFQPLFDRIAGNPPWINWEHLPDEYRQRTADLWTQYRLFEHAGLRARMGSAKDDLSVLMLYVAADRYLKPKGRLGFVITQSIFKTEGGGEGFRRLQLGDREHLQAIQVDDFSDVQCFEGATNRTAVFILEKGSPTKFPVQYNYWRKKDRGNIPTDADHDEAMQRLRYSQWVARPINMAKKNSPWISGRRRALSQIENVTGKANYEGRAGSCTWLNGVYWIEVVTQRKDGLLLVNNLHDCGKIEVRNVNMAIEPDFVFPLLRGRDVERWKAKPISKVIIPQDPAGPAKGFPEADMQAKCPKTYAYFKQFEEQLRKRSGFKQFFDVQTAPFYSVYNVGPYTFERFKVVWREQASFLTAAVASVSADAKAIVPDHKLLLCPGHSEEEVHYICALLNSAPAQFIVKGYSLETSISTHVLNYVRILRFDAKDKTHQALAANSKALHEATAVEDAAKVLDLEAENLRLAGVYWGLEKSEVADIKASLEDLA